MGGPAGKLRSGASAGWSSRKRRRQGQHFKIRAHPRENLAPPNTSSREAVEDLPATSSGAHMWGFGWLSRAVHAPGTGSAVLCICWCSLLAYIDSALGLERAV